MRLARFGFVGVASILLLALPARAQDAVVKAIVEKAITAHGGADKINKAKCVEAKGEGKLEMLGGLKFTQERLVKYPGKFKEVMEFNVNEQNIKVVTAFDGTKGSMTRNGDAVDLSDAIRNELAEVSYGMRVARLTHLLDNKSIQLSPLGEIKVGDRPAVGIKIASKGHRDIDLYFDRESGLLTRVQTVKKDPQTGQDATEERLIQEYQDVGGQKVAKRILVNRDGKKYLETEISEVKILDDIPDSEFQGASK